MKFYFKVLRQLKEEPHTMQTIYKHTVSFSNEVAFEYSRNLIIHKITYAECRQDILKIYGFLNKVCENAQTVALVMNNSPLWVECFWAVLMSGRKVMLLSADMPEETLRYCLGQASCSTLIGNAGIPDCLCISAGDIQSAMQTQSVPDEPETGWGDEIILSTSGTTGRPELFSYTGREICSQILDSEYVLKHSKDISRFWKGQFRQLAFLPMSHIFGLTACYLWFAVFGRTFVFLEDYAPSTILRTCRLHHVTHIFAVPLLWDSLANGIKKEAESSGLTDRLNKGIELSLKIQNFSPALGRVIVPRLMHSVQSKALGSSVRFCISGGGICRNDTFRIVNGCGYHLENGYGMTEIGIASVTLKNKASRRDGKTVGHFFPSLKTCIGADNRLSVKGTSCYAYRYKDGKAIARNGDEWFSTGDCFAASPENEMTILGRSDDMINSADGERINPEIIESLLNLNFPVCVVKLSSGSLGLIAEASGEAYISREYREKMVSCMKEAIARLPIVMRPKLLYFTYETIPTSLSYKFRRRELAKAIDQQTFDVLDVEAFIYPDGRQTESEETNAVIGEIMEIVQSTLKLPDAVNPNSDFFADLGGDSLSYLEYLNALESHFHIKIPKADTGNCTSPLSTYRVISQSIKTER